MNHKGNPDTMSIDPVLKYKVIAHTIPPVESEIITLTPGKHTIIPISVPQGDLEVKILGKENYAFIVRKKGSLKTLNIQETNSKQKYLTGKYDIEVLTLPRFSINDVEVTQSGLATYTIPSTGIANIILPSKGYGGVYLLEDNKLKLIYNFDGNKQRYNLHLLPKNYKVVFRSKSSKQYEYTKEKDFRVRSGESKLIKLY